MEVRKAQFKKIKLNKNLNIPSIYTVHYFKYGMNFRFENEIHDFWELIYIDSGNAVVVNNQDKIILKQGEAYLHKPNDVHTVYTNDEFANSAIISFDCSSPDLENIARKKLVFSEFDKVILNKIINETKLGFSDKLNDLYLTKMNKSQNSPFAVNQAIKNCIELLFISLIRQQENTTFYPDTIAIGVISDKIVAEILSIMQEKLDKATTINLDELSFTLGFSKSHIKKQFKKKMGVSIIQYFIGLKIEKAKKLLSQHKFTVSEISDQLGFSSVYYFSRQFKLYTNMSPTKYINSINLENVL